ncbi:3671_t:CDS:2 [Paraglomus occultum]|uniref:3671_t:CDS:1 n=1 Tax=Paraglomus occultum TaxID=144539 RepID=A0A9N9EYV3_9GLOM|nr:3671_t:CDS:2 [Paraglomus occultum]
MLRSPTITQNTLPVPTVPVSVHPPVPGENHPYYGNIHNKQVKLPPGTFNQQASSSSYRRASNEFVADESESSIHEAAAAGNLHRVRQLLQRQDAGANLSPFMLANEATPSSGLTPLHYAASRGHLPVVKLLVDNAGAIVDLEDQTGETALHKASLAGFPAVVAFLLRRNAHVERQDSDGWTALHNACAQGYITIVQYLLEHTDADVNVQSHKGHTPLMNASSKGHIEVVEYLLGRGADPLLKNSIGEAAYDVAAVSQEIYICELLEKAERDCWKAKKALSGQYSFSDFTSSPSTDQPYDVYAFHSNVPIVIHENERASSSFPMLRSGAAKYSASYLLKSDVRGPWSLPNGKPTTKSAIGLPSDSRSSSASVISSSSLSKTLNEWFWLTDWQIDMSYPRVDADGWQYARSFDDSDSLWLPAPPAGANNWVRRRRWVRITKRQFKVDGTAASELMRKSQSLTLEGDNYVERAEALLNKHRNISLSDQIARHKDAIEILKEGIKTDDNMQRKIEANSLITDYLSRVEFLNAMEQQSGAPSTTSLSSFQTIDGPWSTNAQNIHEDMDNSSVYDDSVSILSVRPSTAPMWENDKDVPACRQCSRKFSFLIRRHHCRRCGQVVCDQCSASKIKLPLHQVLRDPSGSESITRSSQYHRVCDNCLGRPRSNSFASTNISNL